MRQRSRHALPVLALLALAGSLTAGCGSSSNAAANSTTSSPAAATSAAASDALSAADCAVIKPIAANAATSLAPLQTESASAAAAGMASYITQLNAALAKVTSAQGKADLGAFIADLKTASASNAAKIQAAMVKLGADCP